MLDWWSLSFRDLELHNEYLADAVDDCAKAIREALDGTSANKFCRWRVAYLQDGGDYTRIKAITLNLLAEHGDGPQAGKALYVADVQRRRIKLCRFPGKYEEIPEECRDTIDELEEFVMRYAREMGEGARAKVKWEEEWKRLSLMTKDGVPLLEWVMARMAEEVEEDKRPEERDEARWREERLREAAWDDETYGAVEVDGADDADEAAEDDEEDQGNEGEVDDTDDTDEVDDGGRIHGADEMREGLRLMAGAKRKREDQGNDTDDPNADVVDETHDPGEMREGLAWTRMMAGSKRKRFF